MSSLNTKQSTPFRILTASSLFDGHDAAINVFRRLFQNAGLEVIHVGHNRGVKELVKAAIEEDVDAICVSSYQGGHIEYFTYLRELLDQNKGEKIAIFGGGGGTILPSEIELIEKKTGAKIYHPQDGRVLGLKGIVADAISRMQKNDESEEFYRQIENKMIQKQALTKQELSKLITLFEDESLYPNLQDRFNHLLDSPLEKKAFVLGVTGPGGAGKSSLVDEIIQRFLQVTNNEQVAVLAFDPTKKKTGGALLGDRIRMNSLKDSRVYMRSLATRGAVFEVSRSAERCLKAMQFADFDFIILETTGIGQADAKVVEIADLTMYVMTNEYGAKTQLEKIDMIDYADMIVLNKFDKIGSQSAFDDVLHAYMHSKDLSVTECNQKDLPIFGTTASNFNDPAVSELFLKMMQMADQKGCLTKRLKAIFPLKETFLKTDSKSVIPQTRTFYLTEIAKAVWHYREKTKQMSDAASELYRLSSSENYLTQEGKKKIEELKHLLGEDFENKIADYHKKKRAYQEEEFSYSVRENTVTRALFFKSLSHLFIPKIATPKYRDWGEIVTFLREENFPGSFPYTSGVFPLKNEIEEPRRQFAGEGGPKRTNQRFHYLSQNDQAKRLSTAFDSVTLYGEDPQESPDVYGKIGNSGVNIATLEDMKLLFQGFDLSDPLTSVSLTINGPAPIILAMFFNAAIDFKIEKMTGQKKEQVSLEIYETMKKEVLKNIRGTVQADILKEEQAQNTCIFSSKFALKMMGDIQEYFIENEINNFYSVSISGYHIAEAGANPITQLAFTLANAFTIVEYYLSRGMKIDQFASRLSFFFSSGLDPEYTVIGRVARRIWAVVMKEIYGATEKSLKLKYHIQTSGRSLHAQEIAFNDIRTTLQAFLAISDQCNSLHTNAYDEAITTPTEKSVRRAMAIQLILNKEFGLLKCENAMQGAYFIQELTNLVEEAVLSEFEAISKRGGVLGAMEQQYQRHRIQTESMNYEMKKQSAELPIVGVNTFISDSGDPDYEKIEVIRATDQEKKEQIERTQAFINRDKEKNKKALKQLEEKVLAQENVFEELMETVKYCSLGQITKALYRCGGEYRRSV